MQNIIFLDVDGVLNSDPYFKLNKGKGMGHKEIRDFHLQMLAKIYHTCDAKIVLSSSWRDLDDPDDLDVYWMWEYLVGELARYDMEIIGKTPVLGDVRPLEIKTWLDKQENKDEIRFIIIDDDWHKEHYEKYGLGDRLIKTEFYCNSVDVGGLQQWHVDEAIRKFKGGNV